MTMRLSALAATALALTSCATTAVPEAPADAMAAVGREVRIGSVAVTPVAVLEDSRCPAEVQCIQAGTVRLRVRIGDGGQRRLADIGLGRPLGVDGQWLHLTAVCPPRIAPAAVAQSAYRFHFALSPAEAPPPAADCG